MSFSEHVKLMCPFTGAPNPLSEQHHTHIQTQTLSLVTCHVLSMQTSHGKLVWHKHDLQGCCHLTGSSCWSTCSSCQRRRARVGKGFFSLLPVSAGSHAKPAEYYRYGEDTAQKKPTYGWWFGLSVSERNKCSYNLIILSNKPKTLPLSPIYAVIQPGAVVLQFL